ncbi:PACE efflux transporter [Ruegeria conchae]|uniref:PACE efflux transporter n=1 Tax=Ruegeria conchae TaxID=981384 RepID=UPI0021A8EC7F|nr:PACE efflux transporter [Ruegeria conchae]UWR01837.1 PACE efflux transporter [Ruegeria conchae]
MPFLMWQELLYWSRKMTLRSVKERVIQTSSFELVGIFFVSPIYAQLAGSSMVHGFATIAVLSIAVMVWSPIFNTFFDVIDRHFTNRLACKRPHRLRVLHATLHEVTAILITCPLLMWIGGHTLSAALAFNLGLTLTYSIYTYFFHMIYDRLRPVERQTHVEIKKQIPALSSTFATDFPQVGLIEAEAKFGVECRS